VTLDKLALASVASNLTAVVRAGPVFASASTIVPATSDPSLYQVVAGELVEFTIQPRDRTFNLNTEGLIGFRFVINAPPGAPDTFPTVRLNNDGTFAASVRPIQTGTYGLAITDNLGTFVGPMWTLTVTQVIVSPSITYGT
jgi:hypothetical protein